MRLVGSIVAVALLAALFFVIVGRGVVDPTIPDRNDRPTSVASGTAESNATPAVTAVPKSTAVKASALPSGSPARAALEDGPWMLSGTVLDKDGASVPEARVEVVIDLSVPPVVRRDGPVVAKGTSDASGNFAIPGLPRGFPLVLVAAHPEFVTERVVLSSARGEPQPVTVRLGLGGRIEGRVVEGEAGSGAGIGGVIVEVRATEAPIDGPAEAVVTSGSDGTFVLDRLGAGAKTVTTRLAGRVPRVVGAIVAAGGAIVRLGDLPLVSGVPFDGLVEDVDGAPVSGGTCEARLVGGGRDVVVAVVVSGRFGFPALRPGTYALTLKDATGTSRGTRNAVVPHPADAAPVRFVMPAVAGIDVRVTGIDGRASAGAVVWLMRQPDPYTGRPERVVWVDAETRVAEFRGVPPGRWFVAARAGSGPPVVSEPITVASQGVGGVELRLRAGIVLHGVVRDGRGKPIEGVEVRVRPQLAGPDEKPIPSLPGKPWSGSCVTDAAGNWWLRVVPGPVRIFAAHPDYVPTSSSTLNLPIAVEADVPDLVMTRGGTLQGVVTRSDGAPDGAATIEAWLDGTEDPVILASSTGVDGAYAFTGLAPGRWRVKITRRDGNFTGEGDDPSRVRTVMVDTDAPARVDF